MKKVNLLTHEFCDRIDIRDNVINSINANKKVILITTSVKKSLGLTYLLKYLHDKSENYSLYIDAASDENLARKLYNVLKNQPKNILAKLGYTILKIGTSFLSLLNFDIANLNFALGGAVQTSLESAQNIIVQDGLLSNMGKVVVKIIKRATKRKKLTLLIDNAEVLGLKDENIVLLLKLLEIENLQIIFGAKKLETLKKLYFFGRDQQDIYSMPDLNIEYVDSMCEYYQRKFSDNEKKQIIHANDVYEIAKIFLGQDNTISVNMLTTLQRYLINLIKYARLHLTEDEVVCIASKISVSQSQILSEINKLIDYDFIKKEDNILIFNKFYSEEFNDNEIFYISAVTDYLFVKYFDAPDSLDEKRLEYILLHSSNKSKTQLIPIQQTLLKRSLKTSFVINDNIILSMSFNDDYSNLLLSIVLFNMRRYAESRLTLNKIANKNKNYKIMDVLLLNRERQYWDTVEGAGDGALSKLKEIIDNNRMSAHFALYNAIYAVSLLHANDMLSFDNLISKNLNNANFSNLHGVGYYYRNVGLSIDIIRNKKAAFDMFNKADAAFKKVSDKFGVLTNQINRLAYQIVNGDVSEIDENDFTKAISDITEFGVQHLHVAINNLVLFYMAMSQQTVDK